jgi:type IV secretion system protein VirB5
MGLAIKLNRSRKPEVNDAVAITHNPYLAARREWDERYGDFIKHARNWRVVALICALTALVSTAGIVWQSARSRVVPFVVLMDNLGRPVASGTPDQVVVNDDRLKRAALFSWVENVRIVTPDAVAQRRAIDRVYGFIANGTQAQVFISEYYRSDPPFKRAQTNTVSVEVNSVLPTGERTFEVDWVETVRDLYGAIKSTDHWKASLTIAVNPPSDEAQMRINPLGVYVTQANWEKVL